MYYIHKLMIFGHAIFATSYMNAFPYRFTTYLSTDELSENGHHKVD